MKYIPEPCIMALLVYKAAHLKKEDYTFVFWGGINIIDIAILITFLKWYTVLVKIFGYNILINENM